MNAAAGELSLASQAAPACPQCALPMAALDLEGHYGQHVTADLCPRCNVVWFDEFESVRLSGLGWVTILRHMDAAMETRSGPLKHELDCPRCRAPLKLVHNQTRYGEFASLECPRRHGTLQSFGLLLAERGLVRKLEHADVRALSRQKQAPCCLNCGAPIEGAVDRCAHCDSPLYVIDLPRLMTALLSRHGEPLPKEAGQRVAWSCRGCGAPLDPTHSARCSHCGHAVVVPSLSSLRPLLDEAEPLLRAAQPRRARPWGEKLRKMRGNPDATAFARVMRHGRDLFDGDGAHGGLPGWVAIIAIAGAMWFFWS